MKRFKILIGIIIFLFLGGCSAGQYSVVKTKKPSKDESAKKIKEESDRLAAIQQKLADSLERVPEKKNIQVEPVMPVYDPLEDRIVSFSMVQEDFQLVLYSLAKSVGMNLIIEPEISREEKVVTLSFENVSAATVLKEILGIFDLYYEIDENIIRVKQFEEKIFHLNFLDVNVESTFDVGGDVLGAGETDTDTGLSGNFKLSGTGAKKGNPYDVIENMLKKVVSKGGKSSINRLSGSLYIKDTPTVIASVSKLVNHFKEMLSRQILIEARIIEVVLSDEFKYGIDWNLLRGDIKSVTQLSNASWSISNGLVLNGLSRDFSIGATINALDTFGDTKVVSNPSIRSKHGKPAIISVGTSYTYKKEVTSETDENGNTTYTPETSTVFDGLILGVIPFIEENNRITLLINPIKSDVDRTSLELSGTSGDDRITLPRVNVKEMSTTIALNSGDVIVLGGLIDNRKITEDKGIPLISKIPILGYLFKSEYKSEENRELVIVLSVKVL